MEMSVKNYGVVESIEELQDFFDRMMSANLPFGFDIETGYDGPDRSKAQLNPEIGFIVGFSFTNSTQWARYVPMRHDYGTNLDPETIAPMLWSLLNTGKMVAHNVAFELRFLAAYFREYLPGIASFTNGYVPFFSDSMLEAYVLGEFLRNGLKALTLEVFGHQMIEIDELFPGIKKDVIRFNTLRLDQKVITYACEDALWCLANHEKHYPRACKERSFIFKEELLIVPILCRMEDFGLQIDWNFLMQKSIEAKDFSAAQNAEIIRMIEETLGKPYSINLGSPQQVAKLLYEELKFTTNRMTKGSKNTDKPKMSTDGIALERLSKTEPIVKKIVEYREVKKLIGSYLDKYVRDYSFDVETGRVHPSHNQSTVITGRFSVSDPNYQQLPKHYDYVLSDGAEFHMEFRKCVIAPEGYYLAGLDFSQIEIRVMAGESQEDSLMLAFANGEDIHAQVASIVLGKSIEEISEEERDKYGKTVNLATGYGLGDEALADRLAISVEEAADFMEGYYNRVPKLKAFKEAMAAKGRRDGYVENRFGRKMTVWEYQNSNRWIRSKGDRASFNYVIQSAGTGDLTKMAMIRVDQAIRNAGMQDRIILVMNIHDELNFYVRNDVDFETEFVPLIASAAIFKIDGWPEIEAEWHKGQSWGELTEYVRLPDGKVVEKKEYKAAKRAKAKKATAQTTGRDVVVEISKMPTQLQYNQFLALVRSNPGPNRLTLKTPSGSLVVSETTAVGPAMQQTVAAHLAGTLVRIEVDSSNLELTSA